ncbi:heavy-metal-associated domain-containing protein [Glaciibacter psychrotolerans]|uniref:Copper chaperone CopZ n=1 Tax=Glaciibacter psychrotolerans TaxID=670054 RepID=A0A7Z0EBT1_9MICO|nr:heavy metal-associated domain-containing protein [Leifsonia psychrotolerans]NYJ18295.1 copper chaperone CopZ [Leifsonia psychrotolerans]
MTTVEYAVTGMTCSHCERSVTAEVGQLAGVSAVEVNAATGVLRVTSDAPLNDSLVFAAVDEAGYQAARA